MELGLSSVYFNATDNSRIPTNVGGQIATFAKFRQEDLFPRSINQANTKQHQCAIAYNASSLGCSSNDVAQPLRLPA